jgi:recombination protein RecA
MKALVIVCAIWDVVEEIEMAPKTKRAAMSSKASPIARRKVVGEANYFASSSDKDLRFISTGARVLDSIFGGGYVLGRMANLVGDKSTGKTLLAIEACANFVNTYPNGTIRYAEAESAFDVRYAEALGMPVASVTFAENITTVEDFFEDIEKVCTESKGQPILYILDSLDALSDRAEKDRKIDEGSYNMQKPKLLGQLFRRKIQVLEKSSVCLIIISQIRDKIGVTFGETKTRSGGKAMDFYASQVVWLSEIQKLKRTIDKVERVIGIQVRAMCKKNKIGLPFRSCEFPLIFGYGVDDLTANVEWLIEVGKEDRLAEVGMSKAGYKIRISSLRNKGGEEVSELRAKLNKIVDEEWCRIETNFLPKSRKY